MMSYLLLAHPGLIQCFFYFLLFSTVFDPLKGASACEKPAVLTMENASCNFNHQTYSFPFQKAFAPLLRLRLHRSQILSFHSSMHLELQTSLPSSLSAVSALLHLLSKCMHQFLLSASLVSLNVGFNMYPRASLSKL